MHKLSLVFGYRDREVSRVDNCLRSLAHQSFCDFEALFIDYGSDDYHSVELKKAVSSYPFAKYIKTYTRGLPWNRSHALNTGIRMAESEYVMTQDVDLVYSKDYLRVFYEARGENKVVYSNCYLLPQNYTGDPASETRYTFPVQSGGNGIGLFPLKQLNEVNGYDEFYCIWGVEDRDLKNRLNSSGIGDEVVALEKAPVYHQWHKQTNLTKNFLPAGWWEEMNCHFFEQKGNSKRNGEQWGRLINEGERPALKFLSYKKACTELNIRSGTKLIAFLDEWTTAFANCVTGEAVMTKFPVPAPAFYPESLRTTNLVTKVLGKLAGAIVKGQQVVDYSRFLNEYHKLASAHLYEAGFDELRNYFWTYIKRNKQIISDYFFDYFGGEFILIIVKK